MLNSLENIHKFCFQQWKKREKNNAIYKWDILERKKGISSKYKEELYNCIYSKRRFV